MLGKSGKKYLSSILRTDILKFESAKLLIKFTFHQIFIWVVWIKSKNLYSVTRI